MLTIFPRCWAQHVNWARICSLAVAGWHAYFGAPLTVTKDGVRYDVITVVDGTCLFRAVAQGEARLPSMVSPPSRKRTRTTKELRTMAAHKLAQNRKGIGMGHWINWRSLRRLFASHVLTWWVGRRDRDYQAIQRPIEVYMLPLICGQSCSCGSGPGSKTPWAVFQIVCFQVYVLSMCMCVQACFILLENSHWHDSVRLTAVWLFSVSFAMMSWCVLLQQFNSSVGSVSTVSAFSLSSRDQTWFDCKYHFPWLHSDLGRSFSMSSLMQEMIQVPRVTLKFVCTTCFSMIPARVHSVRPQVIAFIGPHPICGMTFQNLHQYIPN